MSSGQRVGDKALRNLFKHIEQEGGRVEIGGSNHWKIYLGPRLITTFSNTPSDWRGWKNGVAILRRSGFTLEAL